MPFSSPLLVLIYSFVKKVLHGIGRVQTFLILSLIYLVFLGPLALALRLFGRDLLRKKIGRENTFWFPKEEPLLDLARAKEPY